MNNQPLAAPPTAVAPVTGFLVVLGCLNGIALTLAFALPTVTGAALVVLSGLTIAIVDALPALGRRLKAAEFRFDRQRYLLKLLGLAATLAVIWLLYDTFPFYGEDAARPLFAAIADWWLLIALAVVVYMAVADGFGNGEQDGMMAAGLAVLGRFRQVDEKLFRDHVLVWGIKAFFLPIMFGGIVNQLDRVSAPDFFQTYLADANWIGRSLDLIFLIDLSLATTGYVATLKLFDWHVRAPERTLAGWVACLNCYPPFLHSTWDRLLPFRVGGAFWDLAPRSAPVIAVIGALLVAANVVFVWATVVFGPRFSNLTNRGIITHGPYRWTKHPAYISKILSWIIEFVPFLTSASWRIALRRMLMLVGAAAIYGARAWCEERMLRKDPAYRRYADWMDENGVIARLKRLGRRR